MNATAVYTFRNFGLLVLVEIVLVLLLVLFGIWNPVLSQFLFSMLTNLFPAYFFAKYRETKKSKVIDTAEGVKDA